MTVVATAGRGSSLSLARRALRKLVELAIVVLLITLVTTVLVRLAPGTPATAILGPAASPESIELLNEQLGINRPIPVQVGETLLRLAQGDLGTSIAQGRPVADIVGDAFPVTAALAALSLLLALLVGVPIGIGAGLAPMGRWDRLVAVVSSLLIALPPFAVGTALIFAFAISARLLPAGSGGPGGLAAAPYFILPTVTLAVLLSAPIIRSVFRSARDAASGEYIDSARSRGISERRIAFRHVLPVVLLPLITIVSYNAAVLIGGAIIVEAVFGLPGFGSQLNMAVLSRDYPTVAGMTVVVAVFVVLVTTIGEILSALVDPRVRLGRAS